MKNKTKFGLMLIFLFLLGVMLSFPGRVGAAGKYQLPTGSVATVTSTPKGPVASILPGQTENFVNVRAYPSSLAPIVGVLVLGQEVPALGRTPANEWILIEYPGAPGGTGWVWASFIGITGGSLPAVEPPPTPSPQVTSTIDPTMAAQFIITSVPTRLPTFTAPPPMVIPTYDENAGSATVVGVPMGLIILILLIVGIVTGLFALLQNR
jgi:hypothetical protein